MTNKAFGWLVTMAICLIVGIWGFCKTLHCNDFDKIQVIQSIDGEITINREGGWYAMVCPKIWTYPKACSYYFSNDTAQSKDHDAPSVQYANTGKGCLNCQVVYRIDWATDEQLKAMHEIAHGDDTILEQRVLSTLNNIAQMHASKMNSTDAIKRYDETTAVLHCIIDSLIRYARALVVAVRQIEQQIRVKLPYELIHQ